MTNFIRDSRNGINNPRVNFESFAQQETARIEGVIRAAQVELKAYQTISGLYQHLELNEITDIHEEPFTSEQVGVPSGTVTSFRLPHGAIGRIRRYEGVQATSLEIGHNTSEYQSNTGSVNQYQTDLRIYARSDAAYDIVRAVEFDSSDPQQGVSTDLNLSPQAIDDLADSILATQKQ